MAQNPGQEPLRVVFYGDSLYTPELQAIRNTIVDTVDDFLGEIAGKRDNPAAPDSPASLAVRHGGVHTTTDFGLDKWGVRNLGEETAPGVSLMGDGRTTPYRLHAVQLTEESEGVRWTEVVINGTDPREQELHGRHNYDVLRHARVVASFQVENTYAGLKERSGYEVMGSGLLLHNYLGSSGMHGAGQLVRDVPGAEAAQAELEDAMNIVRRQL